MTPKPPTYCRDCDLVHAETRKLKPWQWRCMAHRDRGGYGFVDPDYLDDPPYVKCDNINRGDCPNFRRRRDGQKELGI